MEEENVDGDVKKDHEETQEEEEEDETFDENASFPELERTQTGRKTSIFRAYSFKEKGESTWPPSWLPFWITFSVDSNESGESDPSTADELNAFIHLYSFLYI